jgi:hypothetical protein
MLVRYTENYAGGVAFLFIFLTWWTLGAVAAYCRGIAAVTVRASYHAHGTGTSVPRRAIVRAASQLLQTHLGSLLGLVVMFPLCACVKIAWALLAEDAASWYFLNNSNEKCPLID